MQASKTRCGPRIWTPHDVRRLVLDSLTLSVLCLCRALKFLTSETRRFSRNHRRQCPPVLLSQFPTPQPPSDEAARFFPDARRVALTVTNPISRSEMWVPVGNVLARIGKLILARQRGGCRTKSQASRPTRARWQKASPLNPVHYVPFANLPIATSRRGNMTTAIRFSCAVPLRR